MVEVARRQTQRLRQFRLVGQPNHDGRHPRTLRRRRNHRADADVDFRHRVRPAKRLRPGVRGHQSAHARHGHAAGRQKNLQKDARGFPDAHSRLQRAGRLSAGGIAEAQHPAHRGRLRIARRDLQGAKARLVRVRLEFLVLLRPPHEHHRGRHGLHGRPGFLRECSGCSARTAWCAKANPTR